MSTLPFEDQLIPLKKAMTQYSQVVQLGGFVTYQRVVEFKDKLVSKLFEIKDNSSPVEFPPTRCTISIGKYMNKETYAVVLVSSPTLAQKTEYYAILEYDSRDVLLQNVIYNILHEMNINTQLLKCTKRERTVLHKTNPFVGILT